MQQFIDNWSARLLAPITAESLTLSVDPALGALLAGATVERPYRLTLVAVDGSGAEVGWEQVVVTGQAAGTLEVGRLSGAGSWPQGALLEARVSAAAMNELQGLAYLTPGTYLQRVRGGALGRWSGALLCAHPGFGALVDVVYRDMFCWVGAAVVDGKIAESGVVIDSPEGYGLGFGVSRPAGYWSGLSLNHGAAYAWLETGVTEPPPSAVAELEFIAPDELSAIGQAYSITVELLIPGLAGLSASYTHDQNAGRWSLSFWSEAAGAVQLNTTVPLEAGATYLLQLRLLGQNAVCSINGAEVATFPLASMLYAASGLGAIIRIEKTSGASPRPLSLSQVLAEISLG